MQDRITDEEKNEIEESYLASVSGKEANIRKIKEKFFKKNINDVCYEDSEVTLNIPKRIGKEKIGERRLS
jgi:hypothetical protein